MRGSLRTPAPHGAGGFTMIELIVVIVIMAIMASFAAPRFFSNGDIEGPGFAQELASAARYAQKLAVTSGCPVRITVSTTGYYLTQPQSAPGASCDTSFTRAVLSPASGEAYSGTAPAGVSIGGVVPITVQFNARGVPESTAGTELASNAAVSIAGLSIVITAHSGYVDIQ